MGKCHTNTTKYGILITQRYASKPLPSFQKDFTFGPELAINFIASWVVLKFSP
jgi:hypothetical protein